jgi:hypothetical protein
MDSTIFVSAFHTALAVEDSSVALSLLLKLV